MTANQIEKIVQDFRGEFLNYMTVLEKIMDMLICSYFTKDEQKIEDLMLAVFGGLRITFENKRGILDYLYKNKRLDFVKGNDQSILSDLQKLFSIRTIVAHYVFDSSVEAQKLEYGTIKFLSYNNKEDFKTFSITDRKEIMKMIKRIIYSLVIELEKSAPPSDKEILQSFLSTLGGTLS